MKKNISVIIKLIVIMALLSACASKETTGGPARENNMDGTLTEVQSNVSESIDSFIPVGELARIYYLQHNSGNNYQVGLRTHQNELVWIHISTSQVYLKEDIDYSYIERVEDKSGAFGIGASYIINVKVGTPVGGGRIAHGKIRYQTTMIVGGEMD
ncbi:hypothetical protein ABER99_20510 [Paenibacillus glucanolyticus]|jgi:hypothetical protein|uniref:Lipoprotein n=1 Tax=Paenibacillus glucanolyticus TaxID=59843 RepID=A0A163GGP4_9BACL|nr:hypothetical protein [Paenibacillus glucanolyticus]KZS44963.1 hypothetical protein AWU65_03005 [Paenibacillus glucanolyticus]OMF64823.1 hypothetical protein BK142_31350 [Paenibacillus glucanolyticus]